MAESYLKVIEELGNAIITKELNIAELKKENKRLEAKIKSIEEYLNYYECLCEISNKKKE